jgi:hypothetical protein
MEALNNPTHGGHILELKTVNGCVSGLPNISREIAVASTLWVVPSW